MNEARLDENGSVDPVSGGGGQVLVEGGSGAEQEGGVAEEGDGAEDQGNVTKEGGELFGKVADKTKLLTYQKYVEKINRDKPGGASVKLQL